MVAARSERWLRTASGLTLAALLSLSAACATLQQSYRTGRNNDLPPVVSFDDGVTLATIEFDDQGVPWTPPRTFGPNWTRDDFEQFCQRQKDDPTYAQFCELVDSTKVRDFCRSGLSKWQHPDGYPPPSQLECVENEIERLATDSSLKAVTLIVFVHGWKNDASDRAPNLRGFQDFLRTQKSSLLVEGEKQGAVLGIYIGWRGQIFPGPEVKGSGPRRLATRLREAVNFIPRQFTIFNRGRAATRVADIGAQTAILTVASHARAKLGNDPNKNLRVIVIGHSLGGRIVEEALAPALLGYSLLSLPAASGNAVEADALKCLQRSCEDASERARREAAECKNLKNAASRSISAEGKANGALKSALAQCNKIISLVKDVQCPVAVSDEDLEMELQEIFKKVDKPCQGLSPRAPKSTSCAAFKAALKQLAANNQIWTDAEEEISSMLKNQECPLPPDVARSDLEAQAQESFKSAGRKRVRFRDAKNRAGSKETILRNGLPRRPVDLTLLINPASRGIGAKKLISSLMASGGRLNGIDTSRPLIIAVSSQKDWATRWLFPRAMTVDSRNESFQDDAELAEFLGRAGQEVSMARKENFQSSATTKSPACLKEIPKNVDRFRDWLQDNPEWLGELQHLGTTQHALIRRTAPHHPILRSHEVLKQEEAERRKTWQCCVPFIENERRGLSLFLCELPRLALWNDSQFWVLQVPEGLSAKHAVPWENDTLSDILVGLIDVSRVTEVPKPLEPTCPPNLECLLSPE